MIFVSRIVGESYDLQTGKELPKALVLSNGTYEHTLYVDDKTVQAIISLGKTTVSTQKPVVIPPEDAEAPEHSEVRLSPRLMPQPVEAPVENIAQDDGPGADYDDPTTGVASL